MAMRFHHAALEVADLGKSLAFYQERLGFVVELLLELPGEKVAFLVLEQMRLELVAGSGERSYHAQASSPSHLAFQVADLDAIIQSFERNGMKPAEGPYELHNGWKTIFFTGPDGELLEFLQTGAQKES
jgi:lactoylglutathione lyase